MGVGDCDWRMRPPYRRTRCRVSQRGSRYPSASRRTRFAPRYGFPLATDTGVRSWPGAHGFCQGAVPDLIRSMIRDANSWQYSLNSFPYSPADSVPTGSMTTRPPLMLPSAAPKRSRAGSPLVPLATPSSGGSGFASTGIGGAGWSKSSSSSPVVVRGRLRGGICPRAPPATARGRERPGCGAGESPACCVISAGRVGLRGAGRARRQTARTSTAATMITQNRAMTAINVPTSHPKVAITALTNDATAKKIANHTNTRIIRSPAPAILGLCRAPGGSDSAPALSPYIGGRLPQS